MPPDFECWRRHRQLAVAGWLAIFYTLPLASLTPLHIHFYLVRSNIKQQFTTMTISVTPGTAWSTESQPRLPPLAPKAPLLLTSDAGRPRANKAAALAAKMAKILEAEAAEREKENENRFQELTDEEAAVLEQQIEQQEALVAAA
ncbi:hypothetical protein PHYSODRAFT_303356 [Phytophthora sojae]|uniref:Uncharacterized protein n=1 Tax=Phytophthora sojae (strain P6497) TaxID=1094619 RepID=G4ZSH9_PHYSP|nr:hypothetical protein PHYSODRAFT_303356 [Phytophthora sojae]EGZ14059.1 hypothetical protein PHYSODRAFT_303356 [Phytophthora sojae]|eukprot:XP_009531488.1 hypothetical protein PHYSODRAFT_303356 [Phytophthora sojae]